MFNCICLFFKKKHNIHLFIYTYMYNMYDIPLFAMLFMNPNFLKHSISPAWPIRAARAAPPCRTSSDASRHHPRRLPRVMR